MSRIAVRQGTGPAHRQRSDVVSTSTAESGVAIIGILASIGFPAYQSYTIRAQVTEAFSLASELKGSIQEYRKERGILPADNAAAGVPEPDKQHGRQVSADLLSILGSARPVRAGFVQNSKLSMSRVPPSLAAASATNGSPTDGSSRSLRRRIAT